MKSITKITETTKMKIKSWDKEAVECLESIGIVVEVKEEIRYEEGPVKEDLDREVQNHWLLEVSKEGMCVEELEFEVGSIISDWEVVL